MRSVTWNRFPIKHLWLIPCFFHLWSEVTWIQICVSLIHRKKMKAEHSWLIPLKPIENVELFFVKLSTYFFINGFKLDVWSRIVIPYGNKHRTNTRTVTDNVFAKSNCCCIFLCSAPCGWEELVVLCLLTFARRFATYLHRRNLIWKMWGFPEESAKTSF